jgi:protein TonB
MSGRFASIYGGSLVMHAALAFSVGSIEPKIEKRQPTKIVIKEVKRKPEKPAEATPPPPPPPPPPAAPAPAKPKAQPKPTPTPQAAPPSAAANAVPSAVPSFGLTLGSGSGGGIAVAAAAPAAAAPAEVTKTLTPKSLVKPKQDTPACSEPLIKPKPIEIKQPSYTSQAREAGVSGKVRVELKLSAAGQVVSARVLEGLGHGLDEAALEAARGSRFEPATLCGVASETSFVIGIRFNL